jgi:hypothetical protein
LSARRLFSWIGEIPAKVAPDKKVDKPKADQAYTVLYYAGNDLSITKRFLLVTKIEKVEEKPDYTLTVERAEVSTSDDQSAYPCI